MSQIFFLTDSLKPPQIFLSMLPIGFFPCHKGYIVNLHYKDPLLLKNIELFYQSIKSNVFHAIIIQVTWVYLHDILLIVHKL